MSQPPAQTAREAMSRIILGDIDALVGRLEALNAQQAELPDRLREAAESAASVLRQTGAEFAEMGRAATQAELSQRAKEQWAVVGALASRAATEAAAAACAKAIASQTPAPPVAKPLPPAIWLALAVLTSIQLATLALVILR